MIVTKKYNSLKIKNKYNLFWTTKNENWLNFGNPSFSVFKLHLKKPKTAKIRTQLVKNLKSKFKLNQLQLYKDVILFILLSESLSISCK
jgi:hypothetical protein